MPESANVKSLDAVRYFASAVIQFREEARLCVTHLEMEMRRILGWLERDRPGFWKREIEVCRRRQSEARVMLHKCQMRRVGDFRPSCFEEKKYLQRCREELEFAQKQIAVVKQWTILAHQEADEYRGRSVQLVQVIERDIPQLIAMLQHSIERLADYNEVRLPHQTISSGASATPLSADGPSRSPEAAPVADANSDESTCARESDDVLVIRNRNPAVNTPDDDSPGDTEKIRQ